MFYCIESIEELTMDDVESIIIKSIKYDDHKLVIKSLMIIHFQLAIQLIPMMSLLLIEFN